MTAPWRVDDLEIIGYASVLKPSMLPSVVPPVFRLRADPNKALVPPYSFNADFLCNPTEVTREELQGLSDAREVTLFDGVFPASAGSELWIDQSFRWHYDRREEAERKLRGIADVAIRQAEAALLSGDLARAESLSGTAISADGTRVEPLAIKAAIRRTRGDAGGERLMAELAASALEERPFRLLVDNYWASARRPAPARARGEVRRPMQGMACRKAAA
jgi:hypothetical protein